jgi:hypothetical protein
LLLFLVHESSVHCVSRILAKLWLLLLDFHASSRSAFQVFTYQQLYRAYLLPVCCKAVQQCTAATSSGRWTGELLAEQIRVLAAFHATADAMLCALHAQTSAHTDFVAVVNIDSSNLRPPQSS